MNAMRTRIRTSVFITTQFVGLHFWPECPHEEVRYLRNLHRHVFHVVVTAKVTHNDRDVEFIMLKNATNYAIDRLFPENPVTAMRHLSTQSCEDIAARLLRELPDAVCRVSVSEDGENGATVEVDQ